MSNNQKLDFKKFLVKSYNLALTFQGPLISQASGVISLGLDAAMQRDSNGTPVINGSLIRGNIRHTLEEFQVKTEDETLKEHINSWFGEESSKGNYSPNRSNIDFDFYWTLKNEAAYQKKMQRTRIAINEKGIVKDGALQVIEDCFPVGGEDPIFTGIITLRYQEKKDAQHFIYWLKKAMSFIPAMGSFKGIGFGKLTNSKVSNINSGLINSQIHKESTRFLIQLKIDKPFCIGRPITPNSNMIISDSIITGNIIKGVIARRYQYNKEILERDFCFNDLIIKHAIPTKKNDEKRQQPTPLSLVIQEEYDNASKDSTNNKVIDLADVTKKELKNYLPDFAPKFANDWKQKDIREHFENKEAPNKIIILRTEINKDHDKGKGTSKESKLFSLECIDSDSFIWCGEIDLCNIKDPKKQKDVSVRLQKILRQPLTGIGKTKAQAQVTLQHLPPLSLKFDSNTFIVCLVTSARMLPSNLNINGSNSRKQLKKKYKSYWKSYLHKNIKLQTYFAEQSLTSAYYHTKRQGSSQQYYPEWLTKAGSVFVLKATTEEAKQALLKCLRTGLPAHKDVNGEEANWETTPYIPENGYGEITIKLQTGETHD